VSLVVGREGERQFFPGGENRSPKIYLKASLFNGSMMIMIAQAGLYEFCADLFAQPARCWGEPFCLTAI